MGTPEFPNLGKHCSVEECKLIDFLPFTCDRCEQVFCLQHRTYTKHQCPGAEKKDVTVLICPLCAKGVRLVLNEDPNITWESHVNSDCDPLNFQKAAKKRKCPVRGCKELLTFSNTIRCRDCTRVHCLKHRFGTDHQCPGPSKVDSSGFPFIGLLRKSQKGGSADNKSPNASAWWSSGLLNAASTVRASAGAGMQKLSTATTQALQRAKDGMGQSSGSDVGLGGGSLVERCFQCPARFSSVSALIEHVEKTHERGAPPALSRVTVDVCPKCSREFKDPVLLVQHVEMDHAGTS